MTTADGACGTTHGPPAPAARPRRHGGAGDDARAIANGKRVHAHGKGAARRSRGTVAPDPSGLRAVQAAAHCARRGRQCSYFSGGRERFAAPPLRHGARSSRSAIAPTGRTCCRSGSGAGATCSRPTRSTAGNRAADQARGVPGALMRRLRPRRSWRSRSPSPAPAGAASVQLMVVGKTRVLREAAPVRLKARSVRVGGRRCAVGRATPLSVLAGTRLKLRPARLRRVRRGRLARCRLAVRARGRRASAARGARGWVYKVGRRAGTTGAADPSGPFGRGRAAARRAGAVVLVRRRRAATACQRTFEVRRPARSPPGAMLRGDGARL